MKPEAVILIVDDEETIRLSLKEALSEEGHEVIDARNSDEAFKKIEDILPDLILVDLRMPGMNGMTLLEKVKAKDPTMLVIVMTGYGTIDSAVEAMKLGAYDYLAKPFKLDHLKLVVAKALGAQALRREVLELRAQQRDYGGYSNGVLVGQSEQMKRIYRFIKQVSRSSTSTVLIHGESGTGKELVARAIHNTSSRKDYRFMEINCAALTESLLEAELFGYEKGSFTGAAATGKLGLFEVANKGTVFLDEIGEMSISLQAKLLRVLQEWRFKRVGGVNDIEVDIRIIASTNRNLEEEVKQGTFRKDLFYRLNVLPIYIPPLRERKDDIIILTKHFLQKFNTEFGKNIYQISEQVEKMLLDYEWPGNVRELRNVIERAVLLSSGDTLSTEHVMICPEKKEYVDKSEPVLEGRSMADMEKMLISKVLKETSWRRTEAAKILGINRTTLYNKIKEYGLKSEQL
ncbi:MAG: sigma-54-dependent Fis family transcriptional regulator [Planctomycetes bacterium]|nr:sigma-54-dependent Fis family transcriptional regulator [Planctomycetota bacterium]